MISLRRLFAAISVIVGFVGLPVTVSAAELPPPPGQVTVLVAPGFEAHFDGQPAPLDHALVAAGDHELVASGNATTTVHVDPGCNVLALVYAPTEHPDAGVAQATECPVPRPPDGAVSIRLAVAVADASVPSGVVLTIDGAVVGSPTSAGTTSAREPVQAGRRDLAVAVDGQSVRTLTTNLEASHAYTLVLIGNGERAVALQLVDDGAGTASAPPTGTVVNTDLPSTVSTRSTAGLAFLTAALLVGAVLVRRLHPQFRLAIIAIVAATSLASACGSTPPSGDLVLSAPSDPAVTGSPSSTSRVPGSGSGAPVQVTLPNAATMKVEEFATASVEDLPSRLPTTVAAHLGGTGEGNIVLAGHVNGEFGSLVNAPLGAKVSLSFADGSSMVFVINGGLERAKDDPWLAAWAPTARPLLVLITCAGIVDPSTGLHVDNYWVTASPIES